MANRPSLYAFADMTLDLARGRLRKAGREVELRPKAFHLLAYLAQNAGRVVPKSELLETVWPDVVVTDGSLNQCVEEITTALGHFRRIFVVARNSSFTYKGRPVDVRDVGRELGVRHVVEGSVRRAGDRLRITAQLVEADSGLPLWSDRLDGVVDDVFRFQDTVTHSVIGAIAPRMLAAEVERARRLRRRREAGRPRRRRY